MALIDRTGRKNLKTENKGIKTMKKIICMLLAAMTALSLTACGADNNVEKEPSAQNPSQTASTPASSSDQNKEPEIPNLELLVGQWVFMQTKDGQSDETFTIKADGTMEKDGKLYSFKVREPDWDDDFELKLTAYLMEGQEGWNATSDSHNHCYTIKLTRSPENTFIAAVKDEKAGQFAQYQNFFRTDDYTMVELTKENMLQYLELEQHFSYATNDFGFTERIDNHIQVRFKEGVGYPSYCVAKFVFHMTTKEVTFEDKPEGYTLGATVKEEEGKPLLMGGGTPEVTVQYAYEFYYTERWSYMGENLGGQTHTCEMIFFALIDAEAIIGRVYIPVAN